MIAAVTVLYNPQADVLENLKSYLHKVDKLFLVDNSDVSNQGMFSELKNLAQIEYIFNNENLGIATALNIGCEAALKDGYNWVLTMDQDSKIIELPEDFREKLAENNKTALYYPTYLINGEPYKYQIRENGNPLVVMSSGNFIELEAFTTVGGFEDKLFIDYVDFDYCLKLKSSGFELEEIEGYKIAHELGKSTVKNLFLFKVLSTNHPVLRRYYITRNKLYMLQKYKSVIAFYDKEKSTLLKEIIKIILFEDQKFQKLKIMYRAYNDFKMNNFGKIK